VRVKVRLWFIIGLGLFRRMWVITLLCPCKEGFIKGRKIMVVKRGQGVRWSWCLYHIISYLER